MPFLSHEPSGVDSHRVVFDRFELDLRSGELRKNGRRIRLQAQPFQLLSLLIENAHQVVTRDEVCRALWPTDTFVDFDHSVAAALNKVREALGESADNPRFIETLPKRGYRFIGKVEPAAEPSPPEPAQQVHASAIAPAALTIDTPSEPAARQRRSSRYLRLASALAGSLLILAVALVFFRRSANSHAAANSTGITSIAVLPLENLSSDPAKAYIADGMTDELITELARTKGLRVISRTSVMQYKGVHRPLPDIARELGVDGILEGSVLDEGGRIRVTAQLVQAASDTHVWARSYIRESSDLLELQQELAASVAREVNSTVLPRTPARRISPEAHDAYLRGRYAWYGADADADRAREFFEKAIQLQPDYAAAYSGLSDYYIGSTASGILDPLVAFPRGEAAARKALQLDDSSAEAHNSMAASYLFYRWNWEAAAAESQKAIAVNPSYAEAYHLYAYVLVTLGREDEALAAQQKSQELDPFARPWGLGRLLISFGRYKDAEIELRQRIAGLPGDESLHYLLSESCWLQGKTRESMEEYARTLLIEGHEDLAGQVRRAYAARGDHGVQEWRLAYLTNSARRNYVSPLEFGLAYARLGQKQQAFQWLDKAYDGHAPWLIWMHRHSALDSLRADPRYEVLIKRIGLP